MKKIICSLLVIFSIFLTNSANADPTYAVLDSNGNVTNIIVCGSACASGEFGGNKVVLQVAADPVTGQNRGGIWRGPETTTYNSNTGEFSVLVDNTTVNKSITEIENDNTTTLSSTIYGGIGFTFTYNDTVGSNLFTRERGFKSGYLENTSAKISLSNNNTEEELFFENRKTSEQILDLAHSSNLDLLKSKITTLISLLGNWVK